MALVPTRQFYPTSFFDSIQSSLSKFQGTKVRLFRYGSSITLKKKHMFYAARQEQNNQFSQNPSRKYTKFVRTTQKESQPREEDRSLAGGKWIEKWNSTRPPNPPKQPVAALDYPSSESENDYENESRSISGSLDGDVDGNDSTMVKIVEKLKQFGYMKGEIGYKKPQPVEEKRIERGSLQDMFYVEEGLLPNPRGGFSKESPLGVPGEGVRFPWEKPKKEHGKELPKVNRNQHGRSSLAELTLPDQELRRLRALTMEKTHKTRIPASGVTREIVNMIHEKWKVSEIVRLKIEGPPALNMRRMHELLERKTGGMVVWRSGTSLSLYRGVSYEVPIPKLNRRLYNRSSVPPITVNPLPPQRALTEVSSDSETGDNKIENEKAPEIQYDVEMDKILDRLGPRFPDWPGPGPLPVDADQLPGVVPNYEPPYRILPYGVRKTLGPRESTSLRRLARFLPPHFIIGRSRQLQGLSVAMIKLWEKSSIAKISLKRGVQLTTSERMAEELKRLTGGILLSRNKDFLVFYRGKDFLSPEVTDALIEQQRSVAAMQDEEEQARLRASAFITPQMESSERSRMTGTLGETLDAKAKWGKKLDDGHKQKIMQQAELDRHAELVRKLEKKLSFAERKLSKAEHALCKVEAYLQPVDRQADPESISEEERFMFRKLGMRMRAFLLLGRRGVFDGTVENMHLHWKYRELVKIVICAKTFEQVKGVALALEAESGGVLVSVDRLSKKKFAVIVYRGREYTRPPILRPKNLLTKRKALARSIEIQRQQALLKHISGVQSKVDKLRLELKQMEEIKDRGDESLYNTLDYAYPTSDDESEEEDDDAYLATYKNEDVEEDKNNEMIRNLYDEEDSSSDTENGEKDLHTGEEEDEEEEEEDLELHY